MLGVKTYDELMKKLGDMDAFMLELINLGLLHSGKCSECRRNRVLTRNKNFKCDFASRCPKCRNFFPIVKNSFFESTRLSMSDIFQVLFCWVKELSQKQCVEMTGINRVSVNQFYRFARDVASWKLIDDEDKFMFGGPGTIVQIDESLIAKRKYNRGRFVKQRWVLGIYDTNQKKGLVIHVPLRDAVTLLPIIKAHVRPGTEIWTDEWKAYRPLGKMGYIHRTVNHSKYFKDPETGTCTNQVEGFWGTMKKFFRKISVQSSVNITEHIDEYMWRYTYLSKHVNAFDTLLTHVSEKYK